MAAISRIPRARARAIADRLGLLGRFSVLSLVSLAVLGLVLAHFFSSRIHDRAVATAAQEAELMVNFGITPQLAGADLNQKMSPEAINTLDSLLQAGYTSHPVKEIRIYNASRHVVYSDNRRVMGTVERAGGGLDSALRGRTWADESAGNDVDHAIEVYVPLRYGDAGTPAVGAFEVYLDYAPVEAGIRADTNRVLLLLALGLMLVWGVLYRIVAGASGRLRRQAAENEHQARHDGLTGLPNRGSFYDRVTAALESSRATGSLVSVMIVDLDRFKEVNDTLGHHSGDELLREAGERLTTALRSGDVLSRLGGDEFAVLLPQVD
ncbi:MAG TPA: diguanylate cyclase, partial [Kofleriaceae bacterium]